MSLSRAIPVMPLRFLQIRNTQSEKMISKGKSSDRRIAAVADAIENMLRQDGIHLSREGIHFLASTCGIAEPEALSQALSSPLDCEAECICEMICYPDEAQQATLEPVLEEARLEEGYEISAVSDMLALRSIETPVYFPGNDIPFTMDIPASTISRFVRRLRAGRSIDGRITGAIRQNIQSVATALFLKVKLRNARFAFDENRVAAVLCFLDRMDENTPDYMDLFSVFCRILEFMGTRDELYDALMKRREKLAEMLRQAEKSREDLEKQPVEALIMQKKTISAVNEEEVHDEISRIDRIATAIFGRTGHADPAGHPTGAPGVHFGVFNRDEDGLGRVIKILS